MTNIIDDAQAVPDRDRLHDWLLDEMDRIRDPFRSWHWGSRPWRQVRKPFYRGGTNRNMPQGFPFQATSIDARR